MSPDELSQADQPVLSPAGSSKRQRWRNRDGDAQQRKQLWVGYWILLGMSLMALAIGAAALSINYLRYQQLKTLNDQSSYLAQQQKNFSSQVLLQQAQLSEKVTELARAQTQYGQALSVIQHQWDDLQINQKSAAQTYQALQINALLPLAALQLQYQHNPVAALTLIQQALNYAQLLQTAESVALQQTLKNIQANLQSTPVLNTDGVLQSLNQIAQTLPNLSLRQPGIGQAKIPSNNPAHPWLQGVKQNLGSILLVKEKNQPINFVFSNAQYTLLLQRLQFKLLQAQWAVLQRQERLFQTLLSGVNADLQRYFAADTQLKQIEQKLTQLQKTSLQQDGPDLSLAIAQAQKLTTLTLHHGEP